MLRFFRSASVRLTLGYAGLFIASSFLLVGLLWWRTADYLDSALEATINSDIQAIGDRLRDFGMIGAVTTINERAGETADEHAIYLMTDPALRPVAGNMNAWPIQVGREPGWYQMTLARGGKSYLVRILHVMLPGDFHLLVGRDVQDRVAVRSLILHGLGWAAAAACLLALIGGLLVRRAVMTHIEMINRMAGAIVQGDLSGRLPARTDGDEFDHLSATINDMLGQIQILIESVRNSSNAVAHDLRTPLAELRSRLEELVRSRQSDPELAEKLSDAVADIDRLIAIFNALLRLADIDSRAKRSEFRAVELDGVLDEVAELYSPVAEEKGSRLAVNAPSGLQVMGDPYLLAQAVGNLVDNAVKFAPEGTDINLSAARRPDGLIRIDVTDHGPGISDIDRAHVTERFYRGDSSRSTPGVGLGLSVVEAVAKLHGGKLDLADNHPGLAASLMLPTGMGAPIPAK